MTRITQSALKEIEDAFDEYERFVHTTPMTEAAKKTYLLHSSNFVRWLKGDFIPGDRLRK